MPKPMMTDLDWLRAAVQDEEAYGGDIQIGGKPPVKKPIDPIQYKEQLDRVRIYSLLFGELKRLLQEVDFGSGMEVAYIQGRRLVIERVQALSLQDAALKQLLSDSATLSPPELQARIRQQIHALLNPSDWQSIMAASGAAVEAKLLEQVAGVKSSSPTALY